ncbi:MULTISPECIES: type II toxin-antitoxin system RnlB family antitoxin [Lactococcus]|jgi:hypothetical protein|uniref:Type II toxin-antitoxin system RnlB family antitoxin n=1 Tax=Lactococcus formosensis TaxID=1281486 RepID=A0A9Q8Y456_9LACT|nr:MULTISPECIES: type II toxin-antitoxin system RnlB family antitoxin [Lactococcus]USI66519.1 type II toxin-antitoxin system RnlB family antitoxin [Lactococcus petauri]USI68962.1 type II toxin-antitoxin system RnlB family antitoxin [Lactococcus petauri]USJ21149.1 type II toxin-antitoxin system RnlB family antitoxin [Lactococcus formosensis]WJE13630.1 type II toxin-antitoxin system RnlB family antitoxin [Lactococcus petauri]
MNAVLLKTNGQFPYIILGTSYLHPIDDIYEFVNNLKENQYVGEVLLDALLSNGFNSNRYLKIYFNGKEFIVNDIKTLSVVPKEVDDKIYTYFYENPELIKENKILPNAQKYLLTKGKLIKNKKSF